MKRCKPATTVVVLLLLAACGHSGDDAPEQFTVTLTAIDAVKQGSADPLPIDGTPVDGATLTLSR